MPLIPFYLRRPAAILRIPEAIARGLTPTAFIRELEGLGLTYRRTLMLADWRSAAGIEAKKDVIKYIRKDRLPSMRVIADVEWNLSREFMYKLKVESVKAPGEPIETKFINIPHDKLITPAEVERLAWEMIKEQSPKEVVTIQRIISEAILHRVSPVSEEGW